MSGVTRAEFLELQREVRQMRGHSPPQRLYVGGGAVNLADENTDPGVFFPVSPQSSDETLALEPMPGLVLPRTGADAGRLSLTDGTATSAIITEAGLDYQDLREVLLDGRTMADIVAEINATAGNSCCSFSWCDNSAHALTDTGTSYEAYPRNNAGADAGWCLPGTDQIQFPIGNLQMVIRYTAVSALGGTWSIRVYDATAVLAVAEITGLAVASNTLANTTTLISWPATAASDVSIQVLHSTGAAGNSFQLHALQLFLKGGQ